MAIPIVKTFARRTALRMATVVGIVGALIAIQAGQAAMINDVGAPSAGLRAAHVAASVQRISSSGKVLAPASGAYVGVFRPPVPGSMASLDDYTTAAGKSAAISMWYQPWITSSYGQFQAKDAKAVLRRGAIPMITWEPWEPGSNPSNPADQPAYSLKRINAGDYDDYVKSWARAVKSVNGPVMIRFAHEMNGTWYPWSGTVNGNTPAQFVTAWRRVHDIFKSQGATNVTWVWSINWCSVPNTYANRYAAYYPGSAYVDWVAISGFNWGTSRSRARNMSFESIYANPLQYLRTLHKPIVVAEMASVSIGVNKPAWITDAYRRIRVYHPEIKAVIYFDHREDAAAGLQDWELESPAASRQAYRSALKYSWFFGGAPKTMLSAPAVDR